MGCPVEFVLNSCIELLGDFRAAIVINTRRVDVDNFLVEPSLGGPNISDAKQEIVEVRYGSTNEALTCWMNRVSRSSWRRLVSISDRLKRPTPLASELHFAVPLYQMGLT